MFEIELFLSAFAVLFVIIGPPGCAPIFATLTKGTSRAHQRAMAFKSVGIAAFILIGFAYVGEWLFAKLGISLDALRIAGGIMLFIIGLNMVFEKRTESREDRAEDILEEIVGEFTTSIAPSLSEEITPQIDGSFLIEGSANIRDINKGLKWKLPTDGPRTLNGLILEHLEDIPESHLSVQVSGHPMEIVELEENRIKLVKVFPKPAKKNKAK